MPLPVRRRAAPAALIALAPALVAALALGSALAAPRLALTWTAPAGCPSGEDVKTEVDRLLGGSRVQPPKAIDVTGAVSRDDHGTWHVRLETPGDGATRAREIHGASCKAVTDAAALVLALMIDPEAVAAAPSAAPTADADASPPPPGSGEPAGPAGTGSVPVPAGTGGPESTGAPGTSGAPGSPGSSGPPGSSVGAGTSSSPGAPLSPGEAGNPGPAAPLPSSGLPISPGTPPPGTRPFAAPGRPFTGPLERLPVSLRAGVWGGGDVGSLPGISGAFGGGAALVLGKQRIEIGFAVRPATRANLAARPTAGGSVDLVTGSLGTCRTLLSGPVEIAPCLSLEAGRMRAEGFGVSSPSHAEQPWIAASGGGLFAWWPVLRFGVVVRVEAVIPFARSTFVLEGVGPVYAPSPVSGRASAGVELRF